MAIPKDKNSQDKLSLYDKKLLLYDNLISNHPQIVRKGKSNPYTSHNGHMFSFLDKEGSMGLRLGKTDFHEFNKKYEGGPNIQHGSVMREYVVIPDHLLEDLDVLSTYLQMSFDYISTLKPKPTKK